MWRKSSYSGTSDCLQWRRSSWSGDSNCLEVSPGVLVRDSQLKDGSGENISPVLRFTPSAWTAFITEVRK